LDLNEKLDHDLEAVTILSRKGLDMAKRRLPHAGKGTQPSLIEDRIPQ
jgi:hypothetical protein